MADDNQSALLAMTTGIVSNFVANNRVSPDDVPGLISSVHSALAQVGEPSEPEVDEVAKPTAAEIRRSIKPDGLVSFIDGRVFKTLKRHLTLHGMTGDEYRRRFGLPAGYPMTAASYSERRSSLAKAAGLGLGRLATTAASAKPARKPKAPKA